MTTAYALVGIDGEVHAVMEDRQKLVDFLANQEFSLGEKIVEFDYNDEPITKRGEELTVKIQELMVGVRKFHMNKQVGFYEMHVDDRLQLIYDMLTDVGEPFNFNDSNHIQDIDNYQAPKSKQPTVDLERWKSSLDEQLKVEGFDAVCDGVAQ